MGKPTNECMKNTERLLAKLGEYNLLLSILTLRFTNCVTIEFNFGKSCLLSDSHTNSVISDRFAYRQDGVQNLDKAYSYQEYVFVARKLRASENLEQCCVIKILSPFYPSFLNHYHPEERLTEIGKI